MDWVEQAWLSIALATLAVEMVIVVGRWLGRDWRYLSQAMRIDGAMWLSWPLIWGVLPGHFFGPWAPMISHGAAWAIGLGVLSLCGDLARRRWGTPEILRSRWVPFVAFLLGVAFGAVVWAQPLPAG